MHVPIARKAFGLVDLSMIESVHDFVAEWSIAYPRSISAREIQFIYELGGALTLQDVGRFLKGIRNQQDRTLVSIEEQSYISVTEIHRLENGAVEHVLLGDILEIMRILPGTDPLLGMFVVALQLRIEGARHDLRNPERDLDRGRWSRDMLEVITRFVWLCRWIDDSFDGALRIKALLRV